MNVLATLKYNLILKFADFLLYIWFVPMDKKAKRRNLIVVIKLF